MATNEQWEALADNLFTRFEHQIGDVLYIHTVVGEYNPLTDTEDGEDQTLLAKMAILKSWEKEQDPPVRMVRGIMKAKDFREAQLDEWINAEDLIRWEGVDYRLSEIKRLPETQRPIIYILEGTANATLRPLKDCDPVVDLTTGEQLVDMTTGEAVTELCNDAQELGEQFTDLGSGEAMTDVGTGAALHDIP